MAAKNASAEPKAAPKPKSKKETYIVTGPAAVTHEGTTYMPGQVIDCGKEVYDRCLKPYDLAEPVSVHEAKKKAKADVEAAVKKAEAAVEAAKEE